MTVRCPSCQMVFFPNDNDKKLVEEAIEIHDQSVEVHCSLCADHIAVDPYNLHSRQEHQEQGIQPT